MKTNKSAYTMFRGIHLLIIYFLLAAWLFWVDENILAGLDNKFLQAANFDIKGKWWGLHKAGRTRFRMDSISTRRWG